MLRRLTLLINGVLLGLASGVVSQPQFEARPAHPQELDAEFLEGRHSMGDHSHLLVSSLLGDSVHVEGQSNAWNCELEFGRPAENYSQWIHPVDLACKFNSELFVFPLGEGEFKKAYTRGRLLIKGSAAEKLLSILEKNSDDTSVESPVSSRIIAWGPNRLMEILTLRRSNIEANLKSSLECYKDAETGDLHSCSLSY